jgi:methionine synthase I (cobalamin-dependent)
MWPKSCLWLADKSAKFKLFSGLRCKLSANQMRPLISLKRSEKYNIIAVHPNAAIKRVQIKICNPRKKSAVTDNTEIQDQNVGNDGPSNNPLWFRNSGLNLGG